MTGYCDFLQFLHAEIEHACREGGDPAQAAAAVIAEVQANFAAERVYIAVPPNSRREEGVRMLRAGATPEQVARRLRVHLSTAHRWRARMQQPHREGLGRADWVL